VEWAHDRAVENEERMAAGIGDAQELERVAATVAEDLTFDLLEIGRLPAFEEYAQVSGLTRELLGMWSSAWHRTDDGEWYVTDTEGAPVTSYGASLPDPCVFWVES
jgi:hypothetical protein